MKNLLFSICFLFSPSFIFLLLPASSDAEITSYVNQYRNTTLTKAQLQRINRYDHLIQYFSGFSYFQPRHKVSPDFIRALILAESNAKPKAVSNKNAHGLGQIIYSTGKQAALELSKSSVHFNYVTKNTLRNLTKEDLFDPATNILLTCYLIAKYNYKFDGKLELVLSAWNAGEYTDSLSNMKHAPYKETENLIGKVNGYYLYLIRNRY